MSVIIKSGNAIKALNNDEINVLFHGCNCFNTMSGCIAEQIRDAFPETWNVDQKTLRGDRKKLGTYTYAQIASEPNKYIINLYTQYSFGDKKRNVSYDAIINSIESVLYEHSKNKFEKFIYGMPKIGCGLAGGNWNIVHEILKSIFTNIDVTVYKL